MVNFNRKVQIDIKYICGKEDLLLEICAGIPRNAVINIASKEFTSETYRGFQVLLFRDICPNLMRTMTYSVSTQPTLFPS